MEMRESFDAKIDKREGKGGKKGLDRKREDF